MSGYEGPGRLRADEARRRELVDGSRAGLGIGLALVATGGAWILGGWKLAAFFALGWILRDLS